MGSLQHLRQHPPLLQQVHQQTSFMIQIDSGDAISIAIATNMDDYIFYIYRGYKTAA